MASKMGRECVGVHTLEGKSIRSVGLPGVFKAPVRQDVINHVHTQVRKNTMMPKGVSSKAGHQTSAESWGTGRAVARIPRVRGGGTHRSGQGAFGNMCRGGHMFGAKKVWKRIHRKTNIREKRYAIVSAIAAAGSPAIVMSKGHQIHRVKEIPLVVEDKIESLKKTKDAVKFLKKHKAWPDVVRVYCSKTNRAGRGKMRNRRKVQRKGPIVIYAKNEGVTLAFRNIPGVDTICVDKLNLLRIAPGGRAGRFCIWSEGAFNMLDKLYGTYSKKSELKVDYNLPKSIMTTADFTEIISNENIRDVLRAPKLRRTFSDIKLNPLVNNQQLFKLNPYAAVEKNVARITQAKGIAKRQEKVKRLATKASLDHRKKMSAAANTAAKRKAGKARQLLRHKKAYKVMLKYNSKPRKPRKAADDKIIQTKEQKAAFRAKKAAEYREKAKVERTQKPKSKKKTAAKKATKA